MDVVHILIRPEFCASRYIELPDYYGKTPWMLAITAGSVEILKLFLKVEPGIDLSMINNPSISVIDSVVFSGHSRMFHYLSQLAPDAISGSTRIMPLF